MKVVEDVLLVEESSGVVPGLAVFAATSEVGKHKVAEVLGKEQTRDPEATIKILPHSRDVQKSLKYGRSSARLKL